MSRKTIALISGDPVLEEICAKLDGTKKRIEQQIKFLQKQADDLVAACQKEDETEWARMVAHLQAKNALGEYNKDKAHLVFDLQENSIVLCNHSDGDGHPLAGLFELLGRRRE